MKNPQEHIILNGGRWGAMSGENPLYNAQVEATHENLVKTLKSMGLKHQETHGRYGEPERSVLIHNPRLDQMTTLGKLFGQESVIHSQGGKHQLHYTNGSDEGKVRGTVIGAPPHEWFENPPDDYYTHLPGNGYFRVNFDFDQPPSGGLAKALPKNAAENDQNRKGFPGSSEHMVMEDAAGGPQERGVQPTGPKSDYLSHLVTQIANKEQAPGDNWTRVANARTSNRTADRQSGWNAAEIEPADPEAPIGSYPSVNTNSWRDVDNDQQFWAHPNFYEWHDGHTDHHNPKPWDKRSAMDTARSLGLIKSVPGDPGFDKNFNVFHEADHGSYRISGGLHNRLQRQQSITVSYAPKNSRIPGRTGRFVTLGSFPDKHQAQAAMLGHHDQVAAGLIKSELAKHGEPVGTAHPHMDGSKPGNDQAAGVGVSTYAKFAAPYGTITPGKPSNLMHYDLKDKLPAVQDLVKKHGFNVYYAGGKYGKPDLANRNYNTNHLMIYDPNPQSGGDFGEHNYTDAWRQSHELAHALVYPELNRTYGEGRRIGKMGTHRTLNEAMRAVHWEHLAAHKQRDLLKQVGVHVPDEVFNKEYATVMHDAIRRAAVGQFTEPSQEGFVPHSHAVPLTTAFDMLRDHAKSLGLQGHHDLAKKPGQK